LNVLKLPSASRRPRLIIGRAGQTIEVVEEHFRRKDPSCARHACQLLRFAYLVNAGPVPLSDSRSLFCDTASVGFSFFDQRVS
jgi:hypothetical protein